MTSHLANIQKNKNTIGKKIRTNMKIKNVCALRKSWAEINPNKMSENNDLSKQQTMCRYRNVFNK